MQFLPITATPFPHPGYRELLPCAGLAPYVRCFWASWNEAVTVPSPEREKALSAVIPDLCADIIIVTDGTEDAADGRAVLRMDFCGVNDRMFWSGHSNAPYRRLFGIRLYAWQASLFSDEPLSKTANACFDAGAHFATAERLLRQRFSPSMTLGEFKAAAEGILLLLLERPVRKVPEQHRLVRDAVMQMIRMRGAQGLSSLLKDVHAGERQLERLFAYTCSLSPKKVSSLIRYQSLWQALCRKGHSAPGSVAMQDAVFAYGYFDQAHLLNDFKKFHGMSLSEARKLAGLLGAQAECGDSLLR